jgi:hypothetical protein
MVVQLYHHIVWGVVTQMEYSGRFATTIARTGLFAGGRMCEFSQED